MRPIGSYGPVGQALLAAASAQPGTVAQLAHRACVGMKAARYTASRLCQAGELAAINAGRPAVLAPGGVAMACDAGSYEALVMLDAAFWALPVGQPMP